MKLFELYIEDRAINDSILLVANSFSKSCFDGKNPRSA